jgi:hypothetical protein
MSINKSTRTRDEVEPVGKRITLTYQPYGRFPAERPFDGMTDDDIVFITAGLAGRRFPHPKLHKADLEQLKESRRGQMRWYADRMIEAFYSGLGPWHRLIPFRVKVRAVELMMDYLHELTATWTAELIGMHAEVARANTPAPVLRPRSAQENGPRIRCACCSTDTLLAVQLPKGWTKDAEGIPHCPEHPVLSLVEETA